MPFGFCGLILRLEDDVSLVISCMGLCCKWLHNYLPRIVSNTEDKLCIVFLVNATSAIQATIVRIWILFLITTTALTLIRSLTVVGWLTGTMTTYTTEHPADKITYSGTLMTHFLWYLLYFSIRMINLICANLVRWLIAQHRQCYKPKFVDRLLIVIISVRAG